MAVFAMAAVAYAGGKTTIEPTVVKTSDAWYVSANGGWNMFQSNFIKEGADWSHKHKTGWNAGMQLGYDFDTTAFVRPVLELDGQFNGFNRNETAPNRFGTREPGFFKFKTNSFALMLNAMAKFDCAVFQPYVGIGAGFHHTWMKETLRDDTGAIRGQDKDSANGFSWQLIAGTDYKLSSDWALFVDYKWVNLQGNKQLTNHHPQGMTKDRLSQQIVSMGVRFTF